MEMEIETEIETKTAKVENKETLNEISFTKKRNRKHSAQTLPLGLEHHMMKKYVVYYREWIDRSHTKEREYFKIEKHPDLPKSWTSSKSSKVKLSDKLAEANKIIEDLEKKRKEELDKKQQNENLLVSL
jgi:hypothetical protein